MDQLVRRMACRRLADLVDSFRVVVVNGPRQAGKTTLLTVFHEDRGGDLISLDDPAQLSAAIDDPRAVAADSARPTLIDEVQRGGDPLVLAIKYAVDRDRSRGQFVLSGSAQFLTVPRLSESLAGRAAFLEMWPFAMAERTGAEADFASLVFDDPAALRKVATSPWKRSGYLDVICGGSYPEALEMTPRLRRSWFDAYLSTVIARDIREFAHVQQSESIPVLLGLLAARSGSTAVLGDLANSLGLAQDTVRNYLSYLDGVFLTARVPAWSTNLSAKAAKTPKVFLTDSGLAAHVLGVEPESLRRPGTPALGGLVETFVFDELTKLQSVSEAPFRIRYFRDRGGREIDFVLERHDGAIVGIEVKASSSPTARDAGPLRWLRDNLDDRFRAGIVLHLGEGSHSYGDRIWALPLSALWGHRPLD